MIKLARQVFLCANGITRINGGGKELAFALLAACHGGNFALISLDDEVALCHGADSLSQFRCLRHYKELRPKVSQLSRTDGMRRPVSDGMLYAPKLSTCSRHKR